MLELSSSVVSRQQEYNALALKNSMAESAQNVWRMGRSTLIPFRGCGLYDRGIETSEVYVSYFGNFFVVLLRVESICSKFVCDNSPSLSCSLLFLQSPLI